jgi:hypothetical protein
MGRGNNPFAAEDYASIAENLGMQGRYAQALGLLAAAPTFDRVQGMATEGEKTEELIDVVRARLVLDAGDPKSALRLLPKTQAQMTTFSDGQQRIRGEAMCTSGSPAEGLATLLSVIEFYAPDRYEFDAVIARDRAVAGLCALAMGRAKDARQLATQARAAFVAQPNVSPYFKAALLELERALGLRLQPV